DVVAVPSLAFDIHGYRLGYGKGVYDQLLNGSKTIRVGLAYDFQIMDKLPNEPHDLRMNFVVTEKKVYKFS
ncbi:5-formyltetrahydrofolate cyclo-ligase, partial [Candidatus Curtissbacteria bacterium]|nr:5-formyltetrahydrofolate cyclo-ligase [Candidatus Curtissbacteria bacterium]